MIPTSFSPWLAVAGIAIAACATTLVAVTYRLRFFGGVAMTFDYFATAGRALPGWLIRASIVNSWIWTATILVSARVGFEFGVSGPLWYAVGASLQLFILAVLADRLQRAGTQARTFAEFLRERVGAPTHRTLAGYSLATSLIVCTMATEGGAITLTTFTGIDVRAAALFIPLTFTLYTALGGLRLTVMTDFFYLACTTVGLAILFALLYHSVSIDVAFEAFHGRTNADSLLALGSRSGLEFGAINFIAQLGTVLVDQTYWQRAIASRRGEAAGSFVAAGILWLPFPLIAGTVLGTIGATIHLIPGQLDAIAPLAVTHALGAVGAVVFLIVIFGILLSSGDSSVLAASTIIACDLYRPGEIGERMDRRRLRVARLGAAGFGLSVSVLSASLMALHIDMAMLFMVVGILVSSAAVPVLLGFLSQSYVGAGAMPGMLLGSTSGIVVWLIETQREAGTISLEASARLGPMLAGNLATLSVGIACCAIGWILVRSRKDAMQNAPH